MRIRVRSLLVFLLVCSLPAAYGQDLRTGVPFKDGSFLAAGECLAWLDAEGIVQRVRPLDMPITALTLAGEHLYALDADGCELFELNADGDILSRETLPVHGRLQALAADRNTLWVVTDAGEILHRNAHSEWTVTDFNARYAGYYPQMDFRAVAAGGGSIMVAGVRPDGTAAAFTSSRGTVWSERTLDYPDQGQFHVFSAVPMSLGYDTGQDRFYLSGTGGELLALPACSHCNTLTRYPTDTLFVRIPAVSGILLLGSDGFQRVETR